MEQEVRVYDFLFFLPLIAIEIYHVNVQNVLTALTSLLHYTVTLHPALCLVMCFRTLKVNKWQCQQ